MPSYAEIRGAYSEAKARDERHDLMVRFFTRPLSFPLAWLALRLGATPNVVTLGYIALNIIGLVLMGSGTQALMAWGVVLILVGLVLDCADGNMARATRRFSPIGEWLEGLGAYVLVVGFHVAGGIGAWRALIQGRPVTAWPTDPVTGGWLIVTGTVAAAGITLSMLTATKFAAAFPAVDRGEVVARKGHGFYGMLFTVGRNLSFASGLVLPFTLAGIMLRRYELVLGFYALMNPLMFSALLVRCIVLLRRITVRHQTAQADTTV